MVMSEKSQKQKDQLRSYMGTKFSEDIDDQENIRRIRGINPDNEDRVLGIKKHLARLKELHYQARKWDLRK